MGWFSRFHASPKDSTPKTLAVALVVSLIAAVLVAGTTVMLRPQYQLNQELNRQRNILAAADLLAPGVALDELFAQIESRVVNLQTGEYAPEIDVEALVGVRASVMRLPADSVPAHLDIASIKVRPRFVVVYLIMDAGDLRSIVLPVYGYGLWSTMYGYLALEADANTVIGLRFYEHGETPGLGAQIDDAGWQSQWRGKRIYDGSGEPLIEVAKGRISPEAAADPRMVYQVDGITGATMTGRGVTNLLRYWLGDQGFGPYLERIRESQGVSL